MASIITTCASRPEPHEPPFSHSIPQAGPRLCCNHAPASAQSHTDHRSGERIRRLRVPVASSVSDGRVPDQRADGVFGTHRRTHQSLEMDSPEGRAMHTIDRGRVVEVAEVGGLHHHYERIAA